MKRKGFLAVVVILLVVIVLAIAGGIWYHEAHKSGGTPLPQTTPAQESSSSMSEYTDTTFGFSFWYPTGWEVTSTPVDNSNWLIGNYSGGTFSRELDISNGTQLRVRIGEFYSPNRAITDTLTYGTPNVTTTSVRYYFDTVTNHTWTVEAQYADGSTTTGLPDFSLNTMGGLHAFPGNEPHGTDTIIPLSAEKFLVVNSSGPDGFPPAPVDPYGSGDQNYLADTIIATDPAVATPQSAAKQIQTIQAEADAYGAIVPSQIPSEYQLFKNLANWTTAIGTASFSCANTISPAPSDAFVISVTGFVGNSGGMNDNADVIIPNANNAAVQALTSNGWTKCNSTSNDEHANDSVDTYVNNGQLITVENYSDGNGGAQNTGEGVIISMESFASSSVPTAKPTASSTSQEYLSSLYGISIKLPPGENFNSQNEDNPGYYTNFVDQDGAVFLSNIDIPSSLYPNTTFSGGTFTASVSTAITNSAACDQFPDGAGDISTSTITADGITYTSAERGGAAAGTISDEETLHTYQNHFCYEFLFNTYTADELPTSASNISDGDLEGLLNASLDDVAFSLPMAVAPVAIGAPAITSFIVSGGNNNDNTFSWTTKGVDYVNLSYDCPASDVFSTYDMTDSTDGCPTYTTSTLVSADYSPNSSTTIFFDYSYGYLQNSSSPALSPVPLTITLEPFANGIGYPNLSKTVTTTINPD